VVFEPLPGRSVRHPQSRLPAVARELEYTPSRRYAKAAEIFEHCQRIARIFDLYRDACSDRVFQGHSFHTSRWDYEYTGGNSEGGLSRLHDKVVGIIGIGATAVQCIPHLAEAARHLYVFQRTPSPVDVRDDAEIDPEWVKNLAPGWQNAYLENFTTLISGGSADEDLINDNWTAVARNVRLLVERNTRTASQWTTLPRWLNSPTTRRWTTSGGGWSRSSATGRWRSRPGPGNNFFCKTTLFPRRVPGNLQSPERHSRGHRGCRCGAPH
jgi:hypothetical protein